MSRSSPLPPRSLARRRVVADQTALYGCKLLGVFFYLAELRALRGAFPSKTDRELAEYERQRMPETWPCGPRW